MAYRPALPRALLKASTPSAVANGPEAQAQPRGASVRRGQRCRRAPIVSAFNIDRYIQGPPTTGDDTLRLKSLLPLGGARNAFSKVFYTTAAFNNSQASY